MTIIAIVSIITPNTDNKIYGELEPLSKGIPLYFKNEEKANQDEGGTGEAGWGVKCNRHRRKGTNKGHSFW